jgi:pyruvate/2-oxoacid:ferredoxin oxidoreductase alpha subunit
VANLPKKNWALYGDKESKNNLITSIYLDPDELEAHNQRLQAKYARIEANEVLFEKFMLEDAQYAIIGFGIVSRVLKTAVEKMRDLKVKIGMLRPITLFPFPKQAIKSLIPQIKKILVVEMNNGQMVDDVRLCLEGRLPVEFYNRMGGVVPTTEEIISQIKKQLLQ